MSRIDCLRLTHKLIPEPVNRNDRLRVPRVLLDFRAELADEHPEIYEPAQWTRELCAEYLALVERLCIGDYAQRRTPFANRIGRPLSAKSMCAAMSAVC